MLLIFKTLIGKYFHFNFTNANDILTKTTFYKSSLEVSVIKTLFLSNINIIFDNENSFFPIG